VRKRNSIAASSRRPPLGDIAQLYTDFEGTTLDASGRAVATQHKAIDVLRGQPEGDWKLIIGDPNGRE
jgi:hypothetical protein